MTLQIVCTLFVSLSATASTQTLARKPNIVWIWADNLAYRDLGCYGSPTVKTPVVDRLARDGVRLTQYYIAHVVCSPSRAALLTGRQPFRVGITDVLRPDSPIGLPHEEVTLAEALHDLGYATMAIGKWHLGDRKEYLPLRHGFDGYFGLPYSMDMLPTILIRDDEIVEELPGRKVADITERYTDEAIRFITKNKGRPFFLYLSHTIPHPPLNIPERFRKEGRSVYEDAIEYLDAQTGLLLEVLERLGLGENTLVVFSSDNGPMRQGGDTGGLRGRIRDSYEGGVRVPFIARFPGRIPAGQVVEVPVIAYDIFPTLVSLAGGKLPADRIYDGQDVWPLFAGKRAIERRKPFIWVYYDNVTTIRDDRWKLHVGQRDKPLAKPELYDVETDPTESANLADRHPEVVSRLRAAIGDLQKRIPKVWSLRYPVRDPAKASGGIRRQYQSTRSGAAGPKMVFKKGDHVVFIGGTFADQLRRFGYVETLLTARHADLELKFRDLGWSGDALTLQPRPLNFGSQDEHLTLAKADVVIACFGMSESFDGPEGVDRFERHCHNFICHLQGQKYNGKSSPRLLMVSPIAHEDLGGKLPDPAAHNEHLELYTESMKKVAETHRIPLVDLFTPTRKLIEDKSSPRLTINGIHLNELGYWVASRIIAEALAPCDAWRVEVDAAAGAASASGTKVVGVSSTGGGLQFSVTDPALPTPAAPSKADLPAVYDLHQRKLVVKNLTAGRYSLKISGKTAASATHAEWAAGVTISSTSAHERVEILRVAINDKNRYFFYRWRAHNGEYIYGRRKKPYGVVSFPPEMKKLDEMIDLKERDIRYLSKPVSVQTWELVPHER